MKKAKRRFVLFVLSVFLMIGLAACSTKSPTASHDANASGTIEIDETQVMLIVGGTYGSGSLNFQDQVYPFKIKGLKLGGVGIHKVVLKGDVYKLNNIKDFSGTYFAAEAGLTVIKGKGGFWLKNSNGVTLHLTSTNEGLALAVGVEGLKIEI